MSSVLALSSVVAWVSSGARHEIAPQLGPLAEVAWCDDARSLLDRLTSERTDVVILGLVDGNGDSTARTVVDVAGRHSSTPILLYDRIDGGTLPALLAVLGVGLKMECTARPGGYLREILRRLTDATYRPGVAAVLLSRFVARAPRSVRLFLAMTALSAADRRGVDEIARQCGVSLRTIERRLVRARWPAARVIVQSFIALDAVWLMSEYGWSARRVQVVRRFPHPSSVTRLLDRYAGVRPSTLREDGGFAAALDLVASLLSPRHTG